MKTFYRSTRLVESVKKISYEHLTDKELDIIFDTWENIHKEYTFAEWKNKRAEIKSKALKDVKEEFSDVSNMDELFDEWAKLTDKYATEADFKKVQVNEGIYGYYTYLQTQPGMKQPDKTLTYGGNLVFYRSPYSREKVGADWKRHISKIIEWSQQNNPSLPRMTFDYRLQNFGKNMESEEAYIAAIQDRIDKGYIELAECLHKSTGEYDDYEESGIYGGDLTYCPICGARLQPDEDGDSYCPKCRDDAHSLAMKRRAAKQ